MVLPALMHFYGLKPWELRWMSPMEINELLDQMPEGV